MSNEIFKIMENLDYVFIWMMVIILLQIVSLIIATFKNGNHEIQKKEPKLSQKELSKELSKRSEIEKIVRQTLWKIQVEQGRDKVLNTKK